MMRSMYSAVSGLKTHQTRMDVIGINIANVNTVAFKSSSVTFSDILYQTTSNASGANATTGTGGVNAKNVNDYLGYDQIFAVGGTWMCKSDVIKAGDWAKITAQSKEAVDTMLGLKLMHVGINTGNEEEAAKIAGLISTMLNMKVTPGNSSIFVGNKEFEIMKTHTTQGGQLLERIPQMRELPFFTYDYDIAKYHHERWDGRGYTEGRKGDDIPLWAQIVSIADVYDALVSPRCYKKAFSFEVALGMIVSGECGVFNPKLVECFVEIQNVLREELCNVKYRDEQK